MKHRLRLHLAVGMIGIVFGLVLSRVGFTDFGEIHRMFRFEAFRLTLAFAGAVGVVALGLFWPSLRRNFPKRSIHPGTIPGGLCFGAGWAISGACPSIAFVQLGEGRLPAALTILGIAFGTWIYPKTHARYFQWAPDSCSTD